MWIVGGACAAALGEGLGLMGVHLHALVFADDGVVALPKDGAGWVEAGDEEEAGGGGVDGDHHQIGAVAC